MLVYIYIYIYMSVAGKPGMRMSAFCFRRKNQPKCCIPSEQKKKLVDLLNKTIKKITPSFNHKNGPKIVAESWVGSGEHSGMRTALED